MADNENRDQEIVALQVQVTNVSEEEEPVLYWDEKILTMWVHRNTKRGPPLIHLVGEDKCLVTFPRKPPNLEELPAMLNDVGDIMGHPVEIFAETISRERLREILAEAEGEEGEEQSDREGDGEEEAAPVRRNAPARPRTRSATRRGNAAPLNQNQNANARVLSRERTPRGREPRREHHSAERRNPKPPKINHFSGDPSKDEVDYEQWRYELLAFAPYHTEGALKEAILRSLRGGAAGAIRHLGPRAGVPEMLNKLDTFYGIVATYDSLNRHFATMEQGRRETVSMFAARLEDAAEKVAAVCPETLPERMRSLQLRDRFFGGVRQHIQGALRHIRDVQGVTYEDLVTAARKAESESALPMAGDTGQQVRSKAAAVEILNENSIGAGDTVISQSQVEQLLTEIATIKSAMANTPRDSRPAQGAGPRPIPNWKQRGEKFDITKAKCHHCHKKGHLKSRCPDLGNSNEGAPRATSAPSAANPPPNPQ